MQIKFATHISVIALETEVSQAVKIRVGELSLTVVDTTTGVDELGLNTISFTRLTGPVLKNVIHEAQTGVAAGEASEFLGTAATGALGNVLTGLRNGPSPGNHGGISEHFEAHPPLPIGLGGAGNHTDEVNAGLLFGNGGAGATGGAGGRGGFFHGDGGNGGVASTGFHEVEGAGRNFHENGGAGGASSGGASSGGASSGGASSGGANSGSSSGGFNETAYFNETWNTAANLPVNPESDAHYETSRSSGATIVNHGPDHVPDGLAAAPTQTIQAENGLIYSGPVLPEIELGNPFFHGPEDEDGPPVFRHIPEILEPLTGHHSTEQKNLPLGPNPRTRLVEPFTPSAKQPRSECCMKSVVS